MSRLMIFISETDAFDFKPSTIPNHVCEVPLADGLVALEAPFVRYKQGHFGS